MKKRDLRSLLFKNFLKTTLIPLVVIELTLLILYFGISDFLVKNSQRSLSKEIQNNLETILEKESHFIEYQLKSVAQSANILQNEQQYIFKNKQTYLKTVKKPKLEKASNGVFYKKENNGGSSIFYSATTNITKKEIEKIYLTEAFDKNLKYVVDSNDLIVAAYFNSFDNMSRLYPFIPSVYSQFNPDLNMNDYNFYYEATKKYNPEKKAVWTNAYLDPAGQGWMISCIVPIYNGDFLEGVTGLDVTIEKFIENILSLSLPWNAKAFLVKDDGSIIAMPKEVENILSLKELKSHVYNKNITKTKLKPKEYNLFENERLAKIFKPIENSNNIINEINLNSRDYLLAHSHISLTDWGIYILVDKDVVYKSVKDVEDLSKNIGLYAILGVISFYILFFIFLYKRVRNISKDISAPISNLAYSTKNFSTNLNHINFKKVDILEIDTLSNNFNKMTQDLTLKTKELKELNESLEKKIDKEVEKNRQKDQKIFQQARLMQMGEMISMLAHQWRQPLNAISTTTNNLIFKILLDDYDKEFFEKEAKLISQYSQDLSKTIDDFKNFFKENESKSYTNINEMIDNTLSIIYHSLENKNIKVIKNFQVTQELLTYKKQLQQVLLNIIRNSEYAIIKNNIQNGSIEVSTLQNKEYIKISIKDNGGGIDSNTINHIFDPYFTTKDEKEGSGLGLYMAKIIVEEHCNGKIEIKSERSNTIVTLYLPI